MKSLLIMRHAKSSWDNPAQNDHDRPLNKRGRRDAPRMGLWLRERSLVPDLIVSSSARRAIETTELLAPECGALAVETEPPLYHASPETWTHVIRSLPDSASRVLCIGHNPGIEEFLRLLTGDDVSMPTAAIAWLELPIDAWRRFDARSSASLRQVWRPKELDDSDE
jgi:phosphohistidine phosphatase